MAAFGLNAFAAPTSRTASFAPASQADRAQLNNILASGARSADVRGQLTQLDRAGMSRGAGTQGIADYAAGIASADARSAAMQNAYEAADFARQMKQQQRLAGEKNAATSLEQSRQQQVQNAQYGLGMLGQAQQRQQALQQYNFGGLTSGWGALTGLMR